MLSSKLGIFPNQWVQTRESATSQGARPRFYRISSKLAGQELSSSVRHHHDLPFLHMYNWHRPDRGVNGQSSGGGLAGDC